jgi:hypothetical protein
MSPSLDRFVEWLTQPDHYLLVAVALMAALGLILSAWRLRIWHSHRQLHKSIQRWPS